MADYVSAKFWADIGQWAFNVLVALYLYFSRRNEKTHQEAMDKVEQACEKIDQHDRDIIRLKALPSTQQFNRLGDQMGALSAELNELKGRLSGINRAVDLMNEHLLNRERD